jgi:hypothetical protein
VGAWVSGVGNQLSAQGEGISSLKYIMFKFGIFKIFIEENDKFRGNY